MTDEQLFRQLLERHGDQHVRLDINAHLTVLLIAQIQLACRHPGNRGAGATVIQEFARKLQATLATLDPEFDRLLEKGWHPVFDVPRGRAGP